MSKQLREKTGPQQSIILPEPRLSGKPAHENRVEFQVMGEFAMFADPLTRLGGEKCTYRIPTYEALKGMLASVYWKPTIIWYIDAVRIMNPIQMETMGISIKNYHGGRELSYNTYLRKVRYQVRAHFEWNMNRPELAQDRNENKHHNVARRKIKRGNRRDIFLGTRDSQGYVLPCKFGSGEGAYDTLPELDFGFMYHGITYPDEAYSPETAGMMTANFWRSVMKNGIITFQRPEECPYHKPLRKMEMKKFGKSLNNFSGLDEFEGGD